MVISVPSPMISMTVNQINKRPKIKKYVIWSGCFHVAIVKFFTNEKPATLHNIKIYNTYILAAVSKNEERCQNPKTKTRKPNPNPREENGKKKRTGREKKGNGSCPILKQTRLKRVEL